MPGRRDEATRMTLLSGVLVAVDLKPDACRLLVGVDRPTIGERVDEHEIVLTLFIKPRPGFQSGARNPETPVRIELPAPLGSRRLRDGAVAAL